MRFTGKVWRQGDTYVIGVPQDQQKQLAKFHGHPIIIILEKVAENGNKEESKTG